MELAEIRALSGRVRSNISKFIVGKEETIDLTLVSLLCSGHVLLEDVPGVGKTMLARCLAKSIGCDFRRIQFTPDLLPTDLTGIHYYNQKQGDFIFRAGPVFTHILLADEINRATPRTQASLLECMEERQVTLDGETRQLHRPFFVIATQNPVETQGTFPLPEAQLDRFLMRLRPGYPSKAEGRSILDRFQTADPFDTVECVTNGEEIADAQQSYSCVHVNDAVKDYLLDIVEMTRNSEKISLGVSPRGSLALMKAAQVLAILRNRDFVTPDDIKFLAVPVLSHRIIPRGRTFSGTGLSAEELIADILRQVPAPVENVAT